MALEQEETDLILVDIFMPEMDGLELILRLRKKRPCIKIIAISGGGSNYLGMAKHLGANGTLQKPFTTQESKLVDTGDAGTLWENCTHTLAENSEDCPLNRESPVARKTR
jgi:CheY-like chemotaxis protein